VTYEQFLATLSDADPPPGLSPAATALWLDGKGNWSGAHDLASDISSSDGARIHAYLHRKEGDLDNASYWYRRARETPVTGPLEEEWQSLVRRFLAPG
jgi:hypothetical protein